MSEDSSSDRADTSPAGRIRGHLEALSGFAEYGNYTHVQLLTFLFGLKKRVYFDQNKRPRRVLMPRKGRRRRRKLAPSPEHEGKLHNKPHEAKGRPMLPFTFVRQTRAKLRLLAIFLF